MYTLDDVRAEYDRLDAKCNIDTKGVILKISTRGIRRYGACNYRRVNSRYVPTSISLADHIFLDKDMFFQCVKAGFGQRRKTLLNSITGVEGVNKEIAKEALESCMIEGSRRAETLDLNEFAALANEIYSRVK